MLTDAQSAGDRDKGWALGRQQHTDHRAPDNSALELELLRGNTNEPRNVYSELSE